MREFDKNCQIYAEVAAACAQYIISCCRTVVVRRRCTVGHVVVWGGSLHPSSLPAGGRDVVAAMYEDEVSPRNHVRQPKMVPAAVAYMSRFLLLICPASYV